ncbi:MAG: pilus assembly protein PilZ [Gammaproteobacteria bacterium]|nr:PilZ domain-containing protein [Gammaproteobacteria bacterium]PCH62252.1 MAG: pilus assembly protein PilZ [Gammaproteobacteria bacterium]
MNPAERQRILSLSIKDKSALYAAYMPFVTHGGLFVPTNTEYKIGDEVFLLLTLMSDSDKIPVVGKVCWITPSGSQGGRATGIGIQFNAEEGIDVRNKIENHLAGVLDSDRVTHTM